MKGRNEGIEVEGGEYKAVQALVNPNRVWGLHRESVEGLEQRPDMVRFACFETALSAVGEVAGAGDWRSRRATYKAVVAFQGEHW